MDTLVHEKISARIATLGQIDSKVITAIESELHGLELSPAQISNITALKTPGTVCVVTGQQVGLFASPLFVFYKVLTCIKVAKEISQKFGISVVPVFWMQTEDHDYEEIRHAAISTTSAPYLLQLNLPADPQQKRSSVEYRILDDGVMTLHDNLRSAIGNLEYSTEILDALSNAYAPGKTLPRAFLEFCHFLFRKYGLLFFNPRNEISASLNANIYRCALTDEAEISRLLQAQSVELEKSGLESPIRVNPGSPLFFFHPEGKSGDRYRLERVGSSFQIKQIGKIFSSNFSSNFSTAELLDRIDSSPLDFSSSALLRPLIQDTLLPTVCYIGGDTEINYLQQVTPLYQHLGITQPAVISRAHFTIIDDKSRKLINELNLDDSDIILGIKHIETKLQREL